MCEPRETAYEAACGCLDEFCVQRINTAEAAGVGAVTGLLHTLNDCLQEYSRLRGLGDAGKWGRDTRFCADAAARILDELVQNAQNAGIIQANAEYFAVPDNAGGRHGMPDILQRIREGLRQLAVCDALAQLALHA